MIRIAIENFKTQFKDFFFSDEVEKDFIFVNELSNLAKKNNNINLIQKNIDSFIFCYSFILCQKLGYECISYANDLEIKEYINIPYNICSNCDNMYPKFCNLKYNSNDNEIFIGGDREYEIKQITKKCSICDNCETESSSISLYYARELKWDRIYVNRNNRNKINTILNNINTNSELKPVFYYIIRKYYTDDINNFIFKLNITKTKINHSKVMTEIRTLPEIGIDYMNAKGEFDFLKSC